MLEVSAELMPREMTSTPFDLNAVAPITITNQLHGHNHPDDHEEIKRTCFVGDLRKEAERNPSQAAKIS